MRHSRVLLAVVFLLLVSTHLVLAGEPIANAPCLTDISCTKFGNGAWCNTTAEPRSCYTGPKPTVVAATTTSSANTTTSVTPPQGTVLGKITQDVTAMQRDLAATKRTLFTLEQEQKKLSGSVAALNQNIQELALQQQQDKSKVAQDVSSIATGLAGLQKNIADAQDKVAQVEDSLEKRQKTTRLVTISVLLVSLIAVLFGIAYHVQHLRRSQEAHPEVSEYITKQIQQGKTYEEISTALQQSGWHEEEIKQAYDITTKNNYEKYLSNTGSDQEKSSATKNNPDFVKIGSVIVVSLIIIIGILFAFNGSSTGQAIGTGQAVNQGGQQQAQQNTQQPSNNQQTQQQQQNSKTAPATICTATNNCSLQRSCIDGKCEFFDTIYPKKPACKGVSDKVCKVTHLTVKTSDDEVYRIVPGQGSYSYAGAVVWKVLEMPEFCQGNLPGVAFEIKKYYPDTKNKLVGSEIITLKNKETSKNITHPASERVQFTIKLMGTTEKCE